MSWPNDARHATYSDGSPVQYTTLNQVQSRVVDLYGAARVQPAALSESEGPRLWWWDPAGYWELHTFSDQSALFALSPPVADAARVNQLRLKYYVAADKGLAISVVAYSARMISAPTGEPGIVLLEQEHDSGDDEETAPYWKTWTSSTLGVWDCPSGYCPAILVQSAHTGDRLSHCALTYQP